MKQLVTILLVHTMGLVSVNSELPMTMSVCSDQAQQSAIMRSYSPEISCQPRPVIVPLTPEHLAHLPPGHKVVISTHVEVSRCSGSCAHSSYLSCLPSKVSTKEVSISLAPASVSPGVQELMCASVKVEQHEECRCGCHVTSSDCNAHQVYQHHLCQCSCADHQARAQCRDRGWTWEPSLCQCMCPGQPYPTCPTGYFYDYIDTCSCITPHVPGITDEEIVFVVVFLGFITAILSLAQCYRRKIGLFKHRRLDRKESRGSISQVIQSLNIRETSEDGKNKPAVALDTLQTIEEENIELLSIDDRRN